MENIMEDKSPEKNLIQQSTADEKNTSTVAPNAGSTVPDSASAGHDAVSDHADVSKLAPKTLTTDVKGTMFARTGTTRDTATHPPDVAEGAEAPIVYGQQKEEPTKEPKSSVWSSIFGGRK